MVSVRVLLVDDEGAVRDTVAEMLAADGMLTTCVADAATALTLCENDCPFDIVLADVAMPGGVDGMRVAKTFRDKHPTVPVILMTGHESVIDRAVAAGAVPLYKPFTALQLKAVIDDALE